MNTLYAYDALCHIGKELLLKHYWIAIDRISKKNESKETGFQLEKKASKLFGAF